MPPVFEGFKSLNVNDIIQWLVLLVCLFCLAFKDKGRLTWITTLIPTLENKDTAPQPDPAPQPALGINHPDLVKEIREMLREYLSPVVASLAPAAGKPSPCPDKGESDGAAAEPTDVTIVQVPVEPWGQPQPAAVAPVETKKYKVKSEHPGSKDKKGGPSQPTGESEVEIIAESLSYEGLCNLQKDLAWRGYEAYTTWLLWVWDLIGTGVQLDSSEARNLGPLTQDSDVNEVFVREPGPLSLWEWLLMSVRERFVHRDRMQEHQHRMRWKTLEEGIQQLREVAVLEVLFGRGGQHDNDPDKVRCTGQMLWNLAALGPSQYATYIATINPDNNRETVGSVANKLRNYESMISGPVQAQVSAVAKELREEIREEMRRNSSHVAPVRVTGPRVRAQRPPAREKGYTPRADLWFFLRDHGEDMGRWDGKPTSALAAWVRELKVRNTNRGGSTKMKVASTSHDQAARYYRSEDMSDPCEGTSIVYAQEGNNDRC
ncbi:hypothetical protein DUI87_11988 [Hirundo rustica rustica]|uniref:Core shell protein Gag P30 domain-containing protein n=1 Tax=Hirundo rustica rustica TaxID=333673 RepID=A0A3M0KFA3_HIRRU|nr:hypothetical protein DUI87_11988 [Hirundo rustica rustica]